MKKCLVDKVLYKVNLMLIRYQKILKIQLKLIKKIFH